MPAEPTARTATTTLRRFKLLDRSQAKRRGTRLRCDCFGYWFPHRRGGGACDHSPRRDFYVALRHGSSLAEAQELLSAEQLERMFPLTNHPKE